MIKDHHKLQVGKLTIEVNWEAKVIPCKKIRVILDGKEEILDHKEFFTMMLLFGDDKQQEKIIPSTKTVMRVVERMISVRAGKDMKKGEVLSFPYRYAIPDEEYKKLKELHPKSIRSVEDILSPTKPDALAKENKEVV